MQVYQSMSFVAVLKNANVDLGGYSSVFTYTKRCHGVDSELVEILKREGVLLQ